MKLKLDEMLVEVVVDMVVEVIIILDKVYVILELRLWVLKEIMMYVVGWGMVMKIVVVGLVYLKIGFRLYVMEVYVVLIKDDMLLGLNFMVIYGVVLDLKSYIFSVGGEWLDLILGFKGIIFVVFNVVVFKCIVVLFYLVVYVFV